MLDSRHQEIPDEHQLGFEYRLKDTTRISFPRKAVTLRLHISRQPRTLCFLVTIVALVLDVVFFTPRGAHAQSTFTNPTNIFISFSSDELSPASPYPSAITVSGLSGSVTRVTVTLNSLDLGSPPDFDILMVGPNGQSVILMSDAQGNWTGHIINMTLTFDDAALSPLPSDNTLTPGTYKPTNFDPDLDFFLTPAPVGPYGETLSVFNGTNPNGIWSLYVARDHPGHFLDEGPPNPVIIRGWSLTLMTQPTLPPGDTVSWSITGNLNQARSNHTATLLTNGKVLVAGGNSNSDLLNSAELYNPATKTWSTTGNLNTPRSGQTATLLQNGKVLVAGGNSLGLPLSSAELYDPATGSWSTTGNLQLARYSHTATLLPNGKVLVTGGSPSLFNATSSAELYDPGTETWNLTASLSKGDRFSHTATLLPNGKVLVVGGGTDDGVNNVAEFYDPATGIWDATGSLTTPRAWHTAILLPDGKLLVAGGNTFSGSCCFAPTDTAELFDPITGNWSTTGSFNTARQSQTATLLPDGKVLVAGGNSGNTSPASINTAELYNPSTGTWSLTSSLNPGRYWHTATLLSNGKVLVAGGLNGSGNVFTTLNSAELYGSAGNSIDEAQFFVRQHYADFLNRSADDLGLAFWESEITSCGFDPQCIEIKRVNVSAAFFLSIEFQETGYLVYRMYKTAYGDMPGSPVPLTPEEFLPDTQRVGQGVVVGAPGWQQQLENNKITFASEFVSRSRFTTAFPQGMTSEQFVDALNAKADGALSQAERDQLVSELASGAKTPAQVLKSVAEDADLARAEFNKAFVLMQYFGYLRRNPNAAPDTSFVGYNFWLNKLNQFNGNFVQAEMVKAFISSGEYRQRFGQP